ncbi:CPBP family intramembrane glutamic endopeptidase [Peribacillus sp. SCS-155]|uniref:CPBP family intramembrane glutamic endopeptidase n=1 Tax=Peribacillus sedimenti TaxID=3115297 RepID=UPI00390625DF
MMFFGIWIVIIFTLLYEPVFGYMGFQKFKNRAVSGELEARLNYYKDSIIGLWIPVIFILLLAVFTDMTFKYIGLQSLSINTETLGSVITYTAIGLGCGFLLLLCVYTAGYKWNDRIRKQIDEARSKELVQSGYQAFLLPKTNKEKKRWTYVSVTAGITEEIIYRGFLLFALGYIFPGLSVWATIIIASMIFGLAHTYQGISGVIKTTIIGIWLCLIYIGTGSLIPLIVFHAFIDYFGKLGIASAEDEKVGSKSIPEMFQSKDVSY